MTPYAAIETPSGAIVAAGLEHPLNGLGGLAWRWFRRVLLLLAAIVGAWLLSSLLHSPSAAAATLPTPVVQVHVGQLADVSADVNLTPTAALQAAPPPLAASVSAVSASGSGSASVMAGAQAPMPILAAVAARLGSDVLVPVAGAVSTALGPLNPIVALTLPATPAATGAGAAPARLDAAPRSTHARVTHVDAMAAAPTNRPASGRSGGLGQRPVAPSPATPGSPVDWVPSGPVDSGGSSGSGNANAAGTLPATTTAPWPPDTRLPTERQPAGPRVVADDPSYSPD